MRVPVSGYRLAWNPLTRRGEVTLLVGTSSPIRIPVNSTDEFTALALMVKEQGVAWDGTGLLSDSGSVRVFDETGAIEALDLAVTNPNVKRIIDACEEEWPANKSDCSGFVKDVASALGISFVGQANEIVDQIKGNGWTRLTDGKGAKEAADDGKFVIGGLKGSDQQTPSANGHVVVVVSGPLAKDLYPTAYWGTLGGSGERAKTVNWAWKAGDRDKVIYSCKALT